MNGKQLFSMIPVAAYLALLALASCSSSSGGGSSAPSQPGVVVLPPGAKIVCTDGTDPPCK